MEIRSANHETTGLFVSGWCRIKALPEKLKANVIEVFKKTKKLRQDDPRRVTHSLKVGLALTLVSLFYYFRPLYDGFRVSAIWAILTVVIVFEFTVGATLSKGLNRGFATLLAGALGVGAHYLACLSGEKGDHILRGLFVFLLAAASTFSRFFPRIKARYDYGVLIFILTFSMLAVSGYRDDEILKMAHQRLSTILIGCTICLVFSIFICPVWAGENLHNLVTVNMEKLASFLEGFGDEYFKMTEDRERVVILIDDKSFLQGYKSVLNSKASEESLANFARWEPGHGRFGFRHPWKEYLKIGALTRQCASQVEALNGYITSETQVPQEFQRNIQVSCTKMSSESAKALKALASAIKTMTYPSSADHHMANSKTAVNDLKTMLKAAMPENTDLLEVMPVATVASLLITIVTCMDKMTESVHELARLAHFKSVHPIVQQEFQRNIQVSCTKMSSESGKALKELASAIKTMTHSSSTDRHVENAKTTVNDLKTLLKAAMLENTDLLEVVPATTVASLLIKIVTCTDKSQSPFVSLPN
ncbi:hypothetical protein HHK36_016903 [Tetracentron sinense]|uniref:Aluminum-activated malate transporter n=1 Tax=Tetracentron sinense TaxID=13715 RepID=A0A834Z1E0_TETSI|nr:hypothetical protein HHK36_016903 [Tetracentron sinense]